MRGGETQGTLMTDATILGRWGARRKKFKEGREGPFEAC